MLNPNKTLAAFEAQDAEISRLNNLVSELTAKRAYHNQTISDLLAVLDDILDYRGGADSALDDDYIIARARAIIADVKIQHRIENEL